MRKDDIKPGVVYAYQRYGTHPTDPVEPIVFLSGQGWIGSLRQDARGHGDKAFRRPRGWHDKPQRGTVHNDGTVGYPAVIGSREASEQELATLRAFRIGDFDAARAAITEHGCEFILVTSMKRVVGEWEG
jgi:hypothetical protein